MSWVQLGVVLFYGIGAWLTFRYAYRLQLDDTYRSVLECHLCSYALRDYESGRLNHTRCRAHRHLRVDSRNPLFVGAIWPFTVLVLFLRGVGRKATDSISSPLKKEWQFKEREAEFARKQRELETQVKQLEDVVALQRKLEKE